MLAQSLRQISRYVRNNNLEMDDERKSTASEGPAQEKDIEKILSAAAPPELRNQQLFPANTGNVDAESEDDLPFSKARCLALVATIAAAPFLNTMGVQSTVIILPTIGKELGIPTSRQQWIVSAYSLTFGCFLLLWGRLADVYGRRMIFLGGSVAFTLFSLIPPFIHNEIGFDVFRGLQGLAAAAMAPTALGILGLTFPPGRAKDIAYGCFGAGQPLGAILGNIFGGVITSYLNWRWVFWIFGVIAGISTVASYFVIPLPPLEQRPAVRQKVDWIGGTLITTGLLVLLFALSEGNVVGWSTPWIPVLIVVSLLLVTAFGCWQHYLESKTRKRPLMKMSIFKNTKFTACIVLMTLFFSSFNNYLIFATYWFQDFQGLSPIQTTLRFIPTGVTGVFVAPMTGQILSRTPGDTILTFSTICVSISSLLFAIPIPVHTIYWAYAFPAMVLAVFGADTIFPVLTLFVAKTLPPEDASLGGALITAVGQIGRALGLAIATAVQTAIIAKARGVSVHEVGSAGHALKPWDPALKLGIRATAWFDFSLGLTSTVIVLLFIRGIGVIGGKGKR